MTCLFTGSRSCFWMLTTISHSGPRPFSSRGSVRLLQRPATSAGTFCLPESAWMALRTRCLASTRTKRNWRKSAKSWRDVCVTSLWNLRQGRGREWKFAGICFSWRFSSLRKPATLISRYCACWFAMSATTLKRTLMSSSWCAVSTRPSRRRSSSSCPQRALRVSSCRKGRLRSKNSSFDSSSSSPASMAAPCRAVTSAASWASPTWMHSRILSMSPSTRLKSCWSSTETFVSSFASSAKVALPAVSPCGEK
mmetsp:Transcript_74412/g.210195  ORF Transcript_74412/g.210195 Transcript_74412/m.210195 type:complete len:252 (-) Transcript_74412:216-971(-)